MFKKFFNVFILSINAIVFAIGLGDTLKEFGVGRDVLMILYSLGLGFCIALILVLIFTVSGEEKDYD